jgi:hypothetical protein
VKVRAKNPCSAPDPKGCGGPGGNREEGGAGGFVACRGVTKDLLVAGEGS